MNMTIGYGMVVVFFLAIVVVMERSYKRDTTFTDYAVANRSFGSWFQSMSFLNSWLPGTVFIAFAGLAAGSGVIGFYVLPYSLLAVMFMFMMADRVWEWGRVFNLRTQADFVGMRYNSMPVRVIAAIIGIVSVIPWLILGFQSLGLVFSYLSFGVVGPAAAVFVGIAVLAVRQIWTVRMGMRGIIISDMLQGIVAYIGGFILALGFIVWLLSSGHGFQSQADAFWTLPGFGSDVGFLYYFSLLLTGALGAWCWPDIFVRLFTAKSSKTVKLSAFKAAPVLFLFISALMVMSILAHSLPDVAKTPDDVWFLTLADGGPWLLAAGGIAVLAATMGNVNAITASVGMQASQDVIHVKGSTDARITRTAKYAIAGAVVVSVIGAIMTVNTASGLYLLAVASYQGIVQLAPSLFLGLLWRRGTALGAAAGMIVGFIIAATLTFFYPVSIPALGGLTSGIVGMAVNALLYVALAYLVPISVDEKERIRRLFDHLSSFHNAIGDVSGGSSDSNPAAQETPATRRYK